jgi:hypothetical protein
MLSENCSCRYLTRYDCLVSDDTGRSCESAWVNDPVTCSMQCPCRAPKKSHSRINTNMASVMLDLAITDH